jgi:hypothetical protein
MSIKRDPIRAPSGEVSPCLCGSIIPVRFGRCGRKGMLPLPFQAKLKFKPDSRGSSPAMTARGCEGGYGDWLIAIRTVF